MTDNIIQFPSKESRDFVAAKNEISRQIAVKDAKMHAIMHRMAELETEAYAHAEELSILYTEIFLLSQQLSFGLAEAPIQLELPYVHT